MILKKITIDNIASIEHAVIDFTQSPLNDVDLFLIHGETGSGKTTIIDAICLALFNNTARLRTAPASRLTFGAYTLTSRDTSNMLRHGTTDAKAELEFVGNDNNAYTALWTAHATPKNINIAHVLLQNGLEIAKGNQVNTMMKECILGMSFDDFCRTAVLAQGEFTKFLMSDDGTKAEILEKLTATEHFSEVGKTIYAIWKEKDEVKKALQLQIEGIKLLSTEELQEINDTISQAKVGIVGIDKKIDELTNHKNWLLQEATLKLQKEKAIQEYHDLESKCHDSVYLEENRLLADYDLSQQAIADLKSLRDSESKYQQAVIKEKELAIQFSQASAGLAYLHQLFEDKVKELEEVDFMISTQQPDKDMFEKADVVLAYLQHAQQMKSSAQKEQTKANEYYSQIPKYEKTKEVAIKKREDTQKEVNVKNLEIQKKQREVDALDTTTITLRNKKFQQLSNDLNQAGQSLQMLLSHIEKNEETESKISSLQKEIDESTPQLAELQKIMMAAQESYTYAENTYRSIDLASKEWAKAARSILRDGDVCPVCGNVYNANHFEEVVTSVKDIEETKLKRAKYEKEKAERDYNKLFIAIDQKKKDLKLLQEKELPRIKKLLQSTFEKTSNDCRKVEIVLPNASRTSYQLALNQGQQKRNELKKQQDDNAEDLRKLNDLNTEIKGLNGQLVALNNTLNHTIEAVTEAQKTFDDCLKEFETAKQNAANYVQQSKEDVENASKIITWSTWRDEWEVNPIVFEQQLKKASSEYKETLNKQTLLKPQIAELQAQLKSFDSQRDAISQSWPQWVVLPANATFADRQSERWNNLNAAGAAVRQQKNDANTTIQTANNALSLFYAAHPNIDQVRLCLLKDFDATRVRQKHEIQNGRLKELKGSVDISKQNLEKHYEIKPVGLDPQKDVTSLSIEITDLCKQKETLTQTIGASVQKLDANRQNQEHYGKKMTEFENQKVVCDKWALFNEKYGDATGSKFRRLAQQLIFDRLLQLANQHLSRLTSRYSLKTIPGTLTISLCDEYALGYSSSVHNLSGGESFMVSLALALALSSMGREGISMDTLFIDEGFGTLSTDNQIRVIDLLQTLQRTQGKRVGIISHVPYLLERIPVQIKVSRNPVDATKSTVNILTAIT